MDNRTWHDQKPSHKPVPHAVSVAEEHARIARKVYDDYIEDCLNDPGNPLDWPEIDRLGRIANEAESTLLAARHEALNPDECTCKPDGDACPVCVGDNKDRYGDTIPYGGDYDN